MAQERGQARPHHPEELSNSSWGAHRPMPAWQEPLCMQVWWELGGQEADMTGSGGSGFKCLSYLAAMCHGLILGSRTPLSRTPLSASVL